MKIKMGPEKEFRTYQQQLSQKTFATAFICDMSVVQTLNIQLRRNRCHADLRTVLRRHKTTERKTENHHEETYDLMKEPNPDPAFVEIMQK